MAVKSVSIRIEEEMLKRIGYVVDFEGRSIVCTEDFSDRQAG